MNRKVIGLLAFSMAAGAASTASAQSWSSDSLQGQLYINEVYRNPPGSNDDRWQYIELRGKPGQCLDGIAILCITDNNS